MIAGLQMRVALRDRSLADVLDLAFRFMTKHFWLHTKVALVAIVPAYALCVWVGTELNWAIGWIAAVMLGALAQAPFTMLASKLVFQEQATAREALFSALRALPRILLARFFQVISLLVSAVMCIFPVFFVGPLFLFLPEIVLLEGVGFSKGASRARALSLNHTGDAVAAWLLLTTATILSALALGDVVGRQLLETLLEITPPDSIFSSGGNYLAMAGFWIFVPFCACARFFIY
ncbi:MAG: hypothetical protein ABI461_21400, partial [Polyangiaceae bacterium]